MKNLTKINGEGLRYYKVVLFVYAIVAVLFYSAYMRAASIQYPISRELDSIQSFFLNSLIILMLLLTLLFQIFPSKKLQLRFDYLILLLLIMLCLFTGYSFGYSEKNDEFILYFLAIATSTFVFIGSLYRILYLIVKWVLKNRGSAKKLLITIVGGLLVGFVLNYTFSVLDFFQEIHYVYVIAILFLFLLLSSREKVLRMIL